MRSLSFYVSWCVLFTMCVSCKTVYQPASVQYKDYRIDNKQPTEEALSSLLKPYSDSVNKQMNDVIAVAAADLEKKQPEGTLNNLLADVMLAKAKDKYQSPVDAAFLNYGGIRLPAIPKGNITRGKVFELSPFDNVVVLLKVDSAVLQPFLNIIAKKGGWPCAGISFQIKNGTAVNININGKPLAANVTYTIATIDYVANGGDECDMLKTVPRQDKGYLFRDAVLEYFIDMQRQGKQLSSSIQNRVSNAE